MAMLPPRKPSIPRPAPRPAPPAVDVSSDASSPTLQLRRPAAPRLRADAFAEVTEEDLTVQTVSLDDLEVIELLAAAPDMPAGESAPPAAATPPAVVASPGPSEAPASAPRAPLVSQDATLQPRSMDGRGFLLPLVMVVPVVLAIGGLFAMTAAAKSVARAEVKVPVAHSLDTTPPPDLGAAGAIPSASATVLRTAASSPVRFAPKVPPAKARR